MAGFDRPIFLVSSPRSGSSLLYLTLAQAPSLFTVGGESHAQIETIPGLHPGQRGWDSNRLDAADVTPERAAQLAANFYASLRDRDGRPAAGRVTMLEKTPKNSLRIPFLAKVFPDARFLYLYRDPRETLSSMIEAWRTGRFVTYPRLPGWSPLVWSLLLIPGWRELIGSPLETVVARQWTETTRILLNDLEALPGNRLHAVSHARFLASPQHVARTVCGVFDLRWDRHLGERLPQSPTVVTPPEPDKWRRHAAEIAQVWPLVQTVAERAAAFLAAREIT